MRAQLASWCTADLGNGGRGIGNRLETCSVNPLARALFHQSLAGVASLRVRAVVLEDQIYQVALE